MLIVCTHLEKQNIHCSCTLNHLFFTLSLFAGWSTTMSTMLFSNIRPLYLDALKPVVPSSIHKNNRKKQIYRRWNVLLMSRNNPLLLAHVSSQHTRGILCFWLHVYFGGNSQSPALSRQNETARGATRSVCLYLCVCLRALGWWEKNKKIMQLVP